MITRILQYRLARELLGLALLGLAVYLFLSIFTYNPLDSSFTVYDSQVVKVSNKAGIIGAKVASVFLTLFGYASFFIPLFLTLAAVIALFNLPITQIPVRILGMLFFILFAASLFELMFGKYGIDKLMLGGLMGSFLVDILVKYFNRAGTYIIIILCLLTVSIFVFNISWIDISRRMYAIFKKSMSRIRQLIYSFRHSRVKQMAEARITRKSEVEILKEKVKPETVAPEIVEKDKTPLHIIEPAEFTQKEFEFMRVKGEIELPDLDFLEAPEESANEVDREVLTMNAKILKKKLMDFGIEGEVTAVQPGPVITMYEYSPAPGVKINRIVNLADDLAMALKALHVRIVAPIPGKGAVGIEIPNAFRQTVYLKELLATEDFVKSSSKLNLCLGKDTSGAPFVTDLKKMPHLLVAGSTGSGKSVAICSMISSILYQAMPKDVRFILIDPKMLELSQFEGIPHLLLPVVTDPKKAAAALKWAVQEMEHRYQMMAEKGVRNIDSYNKKVAKELKEYQKTPISPEFEDLEDSDDFEEEGPPEPMPMIVIIIDELADLMMVNGRNVEESITRLAQMARAAGIHMIVATQRPSVDIITGLIKVNFPARISFKVTSRIDSRTILDSVGAESLLGQGDMLFLPPATSRLIRLHGPYISDNEIQGIVDFLKKQAKPDYNEEITAERPEMEDDFSDDFIDERYTEAVNLVIDTGQASISMVQRRLRVGYNRAARMIERMEREGIVGPSDGIKPREVLIKPEEPM